MWFSNVILLLYIWLSNKLIYFIVIGMILIFKLIQCKIWSLEKRSYILNKVWWVYIYGKICTLMFWISPFSHFSTEYKRGNLRYYFSCDVNGISVFNAAVTAVGLCAMTLSSFCIRNGTKTNITNTTCQQAQTYILLAWFLHQASP